MTEDKDYEDNKFPLQPHQKYYATKYEPLETMTIAKLLGLTISSDLKWNTHISELVRKASSRLYILRKLKVAGCTQGADSVLCHIYSLHPRIRHSSFPPRPPKLPQ